MPLANTASLLRTVEKTTNTGKIKTHFLRSYAELEDGGSQKNLVGNTVDLAFKGLHTSDHLVALYRRAALNVAKRIDNGEDRTAENPFHNHPHFAKVIVSFRAIATLHNRMIEPGKIEGQKLSDQDIAKGIFAATAHDIFHDGTFGNRNAMSEHVQFLLEQRSIDRVGEWADIGNDGGEPLIEDALSLIYATDVSTDTSHDPPNPSPARHVRNWHDHYFKGGALPANVPLISDKLKPVVSHAGNMLTASLLHDADVLPSLIGIKQYRKESQRMADEIDKPRSFKSSLFFLENIMQGRMTTDVANYVVGTFITNLISRYHRAMARKGLQPS